MTGLNFTVYNLKHFENEPTPLVQRIFPDRITPIQLCDLKAVFDGKEPKHRVESFLFALVEDLNAFDEFSWGSFCWTTMYTSLRNAAWNHIPENLLSSLEDIPSSRDKEAKFMQCNTPKMARSGI
nr:hypothetical protein [Tanacetum cinerariifolium]